MKDKARKLVLIWLAAAASPAVTRGDALVVSRAMTASTIAEFFVDEGGVRVEIEVGASDLDAFQNLMPDLVYAKLGHEPLPLEDRIPLFFARDWLIRDAAGPPLPGRVVRIVPRQRLLRDEITGEPFPVQPEDVESVLFVELEHTWKERPQSISIGPLRKTDGSTPVANVGFVLYHRGVPVNDFRYLGAESTVDLDWNDPWYSRFRNRNLKRQYDAPLSVFLYVDFFEIRKEIVVRPKDLQQWVDLGLEESQMISVEEQAILKERVANFLATRGPVTVDGRAVPGTLDRIHFIRRSLRTTGVVDPPEPLDLNTATLGVIFVYPLDGLPQQVTVAWDLFAPKIQNVPAAATDEAGGLPSVLTPVDPLLVWTNFLTNPTVPAMMAVSSPEVPRISIPVMSGFCFGLVLLLLPIGYRRAKKGNGVPQGLVLAAATSLVVGVLCLPYARASLPSPLARGPVLESGQAKEVVQSLLYNVYRAFDHRDERLVYDRLTLSISGELLSEVYLQVRRSMELENQGGARVKVDDVVVLDIAQAKESKTSGCVYQCRWTAAGSVGHWGHIHRRANRYDAAITIEPVEGVWKITGIDLREEQRVDPNRPSNSSEKAT